MDPPSRCQMEGCKKKLTLASVSCKCKKFYCHGHRSDVAHSCPFDYKEEHRQQLNRYLSTPVLAQKVDPI